MVENSSSSFRIQIGEIRERTVDSTGRLTFDREYADESFQVAVLTEDESSRLEVSEVLEVDADERGRINIGGEYSGKTIQIAERTGGDSSQ